MSNEQKFDEHIKTRQKVAQRKIKLTNYIILQNDIKIKQTRKLTGETQLLIEGKFREEREGGIFNQ